MPKGDRDKGSRPKGEGYPSGKGDKTNGKYEKDEYGTKGERGTPKSGGKGEREDFGFKGDKGGEKGGFKGGKPRQEKLVSRGLRGKVFSFISKKPSGFIKRLDGRPDVYFDLVDVVGHPNEKVEINDPVEFDVVEGTDERLYAARVKKLPPDTPMTEDKQPLKLSTPVTASTAGSLTSGGFSLGGKLGPGSKLGGKLSASPLSLRPGGALTLAPGGGADKKKEQQARSAGADEDTDDCQRAPDGVLWGRIVSTRQAYGFLQQLGESADKGDIFFRAADVIGMSGNDPGMEGLGLQVSLPPGRHSCGYKSFWMSSDDEVSFEVSKDHTGKPCAVNIFKERKGAWRTGQSSRATLGAQSKKKENVKDQVKRLLEMDADQVLQHASLFKDVLENPDFDANPSHLYSIIGLLASKELAEDTRSDQLYRIFLASRTMQASLRTAVIKQSQGARHSGNFLEDCLRLIVEIVLRSPVPSDLRGQLPLVELVEALENGVREGSTLTKEGLPEDMVQMLTCLKKHFPEEVNLSRLLGTRAPRVQRSAAEDYTELMEADFYQDMPILPTSAEMLGQCAFELQQNMNTYEKCEDYIQTHFMLLREDYIEPLRAGIKLFMENKHSPKDLHVYTGVKVVGMLSTREGLVYRIELPKEQIRRINWEKSKQLMYGSLLCFSDDNFETLVWATVWRRDESLIATEAQLDVRLPFESFDDRLAPGKTFCCIENVTIYFEAYRHVLIAIQSMRPADVPFQQTLLSPQPDSTPPAYLKADNDMFHFQNVFHSCQRPDAPAAPKTFKILQAWPDTLLDTLDIDPSQLEAIQHGVTNCVSLIQGPPGTGKTWVGLKIMQALLDNTRSHRHSPILVVCYTNHALDQFLEGIFRFCERVARIGSRSKSETLKDRNLKELVFGIQPSKEYMLARRALMERRDTLRKQISKILHDVDKHEVELEDAQYLMTESRFERFYQGFLDYVGGKSVHLPDDASDVDEEIWNKMMRAWLDTSDPSKCIAGMIPKVSGGLPARDRVAGLSDDPNSNGNDEADVEEAEEAAEVAHDRKIDDEAVEQKKTGDLFMELKNAWLPYEEDYLDSLQTSEQRSLDWRNEDLWRLSRTLRREVYRRWLLEVHHEARENLPELTRQLERNADNREALERDRKLSVLRELEVVGMTTTAVSKYQQLLRELRPEIVIVEEAAEVLEAHILTALQPRTQAVILIGDHQQLRPSTAVYRLSKNFHLDVSLFERLIRNGASHITLEQQRRMHPKISRLMKPLYPALRDHQSVSEYPEIMGVDARCFFMTHSYFEDDEGESHSKTNSFEVNFVAALVAHLVASGYEESQITVLSPYLGQVRNLKNKIKRHGSTENVAVMAVDNFQGEENDVIILSLVRSNRNRSMGFLAVENRINVALTRAKHGMFIIGNGGMLRGHPLWNSIMDELRTDGCFSERLPLLEPESGGIFEVKNADDISVMLDDPLFEDGSNRNGGGARAVADRWAGLGQEEKLDGKGKFRGQRDKGNGKGRKGDDRFQDGDRSSNRKDKDKQRGGKDRRDDRMPLGAPSDRSSAGDTSPLSPPGARLSKAQADGSRNDDAAPPAPPPTRMQADDLHPECELVMKKDEDELGEGDSNKKGGKKNNKKAANKVVMRWG